jgi:hypothetical protein
MDRMLKIGMAGPDVVEAQTLLNQRRPSQLPPLVSDGKFGPRTLSRVQEFQRNKGLDPDGIIGPKTWAALRNGGMPGTGPGGGNTRPALTLLCGNADPENQALMLLYQKAFMDAMKAVPRVPGGQFDPSNLLGILPVIAGAAAAYLSTISPLDMANQYPIVQPVFGTSIDYTRVYYSTLSGAKNRAFVTAYPIPNLASITGLGTPTYIQVMHLGKNTLDPPTLIHEMTHVWQSQHHSLPTAFMANAVSCQATALAKNVALGQIDSSITKDPYYPASYPYTAYGWLPGTATAPKSFGDYGAEQIAQMVQKAEMSPDVRKHVKSVAALALDADNTKSLKNNSSVEDLRDANVKV